VAINLEKETKELKVVLTKKISKNIKATVGFGGDVSGSIGSFARSGNYEKVLIKMGTIGLIFDDNGELDICIFGCTFKELPTLTAANIDGYFHKYFDIDGSTCPAGMIEFMLKKYGFLKKGLFKSKWSPKSLSGYPSIQYILTDGHFDAGEDDKVFELLSNSAKEGCDIFFMFIGLGSSVDINYLRNLANLPNVGFLLVDTQWVNSDRVYDDLLSDKLCKWLCK
jgi:hypothetical protein